MCVCGVCSLCVCVCKPSHHVALIFHAFSWQCQNFARSFCSQSLPSHSLSLSLPLSRTLSHPLSLYQLGSCQWACQAASCNCHAPPTPRTATPSLSRSLEQLTVSGCNSICQLPLEDLISCLHHHYHYHHHFHYAFYLLLTGARCDVSALFLFFSCCCCCFFFFTCCFACSVFMCAAIL